MNARELMDLLESSPSLEEAFDMSRLEKYFNVHWYGTHSADLLCEGAKFYLKSDSSGVCIQRLMLQAAPPMSAGIGALMKAHPSAKARRELIESCLTPIGLEEYKRFRKTRRAEAEARNKAESEKYIKQENQDLSVDLEARKRELGIREDVQQSASLTKKKGSISRNILDFLGSDK